MASYTTVMLYKQFLDFWHKSGISPLNFEKESSSNTFDIEQNKSDREDDPNKIRNYYFYHVTSWRKANFRFWFTFVFSILSFCFSFIKLLIFINSPEADTPSVIGSICWCSYILSCFIINIVQIKYSQAICKFFHEWQQVEGDILSVSKSILLLRETTDHKFWNEFHGIPNFYFKSQRWGMRPFTITIPTSIVLMGFNIAFSPRYPMYLYSLVPVGQEIPWLKILCFFLTWTEVFFFALCENQIEILYTAFSRSVTCCLRILTMPAHIWNPYNSKIEDKSYYFRHRNEIQKHLKVKTLTASPISGAEVLSTFEDSIERYEKLNYLVTTFNRIFSWPMFLFKTLVMVRLCCYVYVILKHPKETAFPATIVFPYAVVAIFVKFGLSLKSLGETHNYSTKYLASWNKLLLLLNQQPNWRERLLQSCSSFGFKCGTLYLIRPQTILTFYSVTLTYLIILLQL